MFVFLKKHFSFKGKNCNQLSLLTTWDIQLLCYHKITKIWIPPPTWILVYTLPPADVHNFTSPSLHPHPLQKQ